MPITPSEIISLFRLSWDALRGTLRFVQRNKRKLSSAEKLELRNKWKPLFNNHLAELHHKKLTSEVVVRDMKRIDAYPDVSKGRGISSWFRVGLIDTYERGIMVGLRWEEITEEAEGFRYTDWSKGEHGRKVVLTGYIPYENIESVDWDGDQYYSDPHVYSYFAFKGEPYEKLAFCERHEFNGWPHYTEVVDYDSVRKRSKRLGIIR